MYIHLSSAKARLLLLITLWSVAANTAFSQPGIPPYRFITVDVQKVKGVFPKVFNECVGAGRANEGLRADWQRQLTQVKEQLGFRYIRMHGLLHDDMGVYSEDRAGNPVYNWQYIDELYDFLLSIHIRPFVELGFMPQALASGNKTIFWWRGNVTPPKNYDKWAGLIRALTQHWVERYGEEEVKHWYFEVWNEPNLKDAFWTGDEAEYYQLYNYAAKAIKSVSAAFKVGGPATAGNGWIKEFIHYCVQHQVPVDFVSTHTYGVDQGFLDENGSRGTVLSKNEQAIYGDVQRVKKIIAESALPHLELHYTEWSSSYTPADPIHDSYHEAAYILDKIHKTGNAANSLSYWTFTDIFEEAGPRNTPFHGGFGLVNYQDILKPAYYAYQYLNRMGNQELYSDDTDTASWASKNESGEIQVLLWDFTNSPPPDSINNQQYFSKDLPADKKGRFVLTFKHLPDGAYEWKGYKTGYRANDAYTAYLDMGVPQQLSKQQVAILKDKSKDEVVENSTIIVKNGTAAGGTFTMLTNDVWLFTLKKK
ncbi:xylan 1,4-beta-xylosidase [Filimonas lacunae]|uniref:Xylan 1,4-beta-xylosidase n=1 Tax=Filimonas lacunae TaxID=477680 RepID=A0A173MBV7_9BACT|nr:glycoside hydrolase [Filimonas lacunae]BAV04941.1 beta-xylosidase [Filimonas lacunae]SIT33752.1 xylan 1,4-beta-xylosidase [Filimonas lacunae]